jgi:hypothetical protein
MGSRPEAWLRGPVAGVPDLLQHVAHGLQHAFDEVEEAIADLSIDELNARPGGVASVAYHVRHSMGSLDRLFTYARGESLSEEQLAALRAETSFDGVTVDAHSLGGELSRAVGRAIEILRATDERSVLQAREVGRLKLPSSVIGLLSHAADHTARHAGQIVTTAKLVRSMRA